MTEVKTKEIGLVINTSREEEIEVSIFNKNKKSKNYDEDTVNEKKELNFSIRKTKLDENGI